MLSYVFESAGLATVALISMREVAARMPIPRGLFCDFPLGRPLGKPGDPGFQHRVLAAAFALLETATEPTLATFPEVVREEGDVPLACPLPARMDASLPASVDEMRGLRPAYDRATAGGVRTALEPETVEAALLAFERVVAGTPWGEAGIPDNPLTAALAIPRVLRAGRRRAGRARARGALGGIVVRPADRGRRAAARGATHHA